MRPLPLYDEAVTELLAEQARLGEREVRERERLRENLTDLARAMEGQGCFEQAWPGERALWGVDGGLARRRRFGDSLALLSAVAAPASGRPRAKGELLRHSHDPSAEILLRALLAVEELLTARQCADGGGWVLLDGSFSSGLVAVRQALGRLEAGCDDLAALLAERLPDWVETLAELGRGRLKIAALPKLTAQSLLREYLGLPFPVSDRALLSLVLPPGWWISGQRLAAFLDGDLTSVPGRRWPLEPLLARRLEEAVTGLSLSLVRLTFRPPLGGAAVEVETTSDPGAAVSALWDQFPTNRLKEPLLLVAADEAAKGLSALLGPDEALSYDAYRSPR